MLSLVEIIQIGYKSDVRFVVDLRKICSRISDFWINSKWQPIGANRKNKSDNQNSDFHPIFIRFSYDFYLIFLFLRMQYLIWYLVIIKE